MADAKAHPSSGLILRRVIGAEYDHLDTLTVRTSLAKYDEIYETADIIFATDGACDADAVSSRKDKEVCAGFNTDCSDPANPASAEALPLFKNSFLDIACTNCFAAFDADVFIEVHIRGFEVVNASAGLRNVVAKAATVVDAQAEARWSTAMDKTPDVLRKTNLIDFKIGPVPFLIWVEVPAHLMASLQFNAAAEASFGATMEWDFGDAYVSWDPQTHWRQTKPAPKLTFTPQLATSASLDLVAELTVAPTLEAHFDSILTYTMAVKPTITAEVKGSESGKNVCLTSSYNVDVTSTVDLDINIPWANIKKDRTWTNTLVHTGDVPIADKCLEFIADL